MIRPSYNSISYNTYRAPKRLALFASEELMEHSIQRRNDPRCAGFDFGVGRRQQRFWRRSRRRSRAHRPDGSLQAVEIQRRDLAIHGGDQQNLVGKAWWMRFGWSGCRR